MKCEPGASGKTFQKKDANTKLSTQSALAKQKKEKGWGGRERREYVQRP